MNEKIKLYNPNLLGERFREIIQKAIADGKFKNASHLAEVAGVDQGTLSKYLTGKSSGMHLDNVGRILDVLGGDICFPDLGGEMAREVCFVDARVVNVGDALPTPDAEDYFAVPLVE